MPYNNLSSCQRTRGVHLHLQDPTTVEEIERLRDEGAEKQLRALLGSRMVFGTAGLRAKMGAGYCYMNDLTVIQTAQVYNNY